MEPVSVVLVGIGGYGESVLATLLDRVERDAFRIAGAVDPAPERCGRLPELEALDVPVFGTLEAFYAERGAELAVINSPIQFHCPQTCLALARGSHVLCEKPLAATVQEAGRMAEARDAAGRFVAIGYQWSFTPVIQALKRDAAGGLFGAPKRLRCICLWPRPRSYYERNNWAGALRDPDGRWVLDSPVNNACAHYLHNMLYLLGGRPERSARPAELVGELYRANQITNFDTAALRCRTDSGVEVLFYATHAVRELLGPVFSFEFVDARVELAGREEGIVARFRDGRVMRYGMPDNRPDGKVRHALARVCGGGPALCDIETARAHTLCVNGLQESAPAIAGFPADLVRADPRDSDELTWVKGLGETLLRCYDEGALPAELGVPWSAAGRRVDLTQYTRFPSPQAEAEQ